MSCGKFTVRLPPDLDSRFKDEAGRKNTTPSELARQYIEKGLDVAAYENNISLIAEVTENSLSKILEPYMKRIIALIQKNGKIEAAAYFLLLHQVMKEKGISDGTLDVVEACNKLAIGYIKQQNSNVEEYLMNTKELTEKAFQIGRSLYCVDDD